MESKNEVFDVQQFQRDRGNQNQNEYGLLNNNLSVKITESNITDHMMNNKRRRGLKHVRSTNHSMNVNSLHHSKSGQLPLSS